MQVFGVAGTSVVACVWFIIVTSMSHEHWMSPLLVALTPIVFSVSSIPTVKTPSCDNDVPEDVFLCSSYVYEMGAFPSMLPVLLCRLISEGSIKPGGFAIVDDVNPGGYTLLLEKQ